MAVVTQLAENEQNVTDSAIYWAWKLFGVCGVGTESESWESSEHTLEGIKVPFTWQF
jgi:hypothetical protein